MFIELTEAVFVIMIVFVIIFYILGLEWLLAKAKLGISSLTCAKMFLGFNTRPHQFC